MTESKLAKVDDLERLEHDKKLRSRIAIDPEIFSGQPCIKGHRIWVSLILDYLAAGETVEGILEAYPSIERDDVLACIAYVAEFR